MTEYDYSPEAYERYQSTQERIARWVNQTEEHRLQFDSGESRKPSFFQRLTQRRKSQSYHEVRPRRNSSSSSSSSSSSTAPYSSSPRAPGPMPYQPHSPSHVIHPQHRPSHARHHSSHHHSSSYRAPVYLMSPPTSPAQAYPYPYGPPTNPGQATSPGSYVYPSMQGVSSASASSSYYQSPQGYFPPNTTYPAAQAYAPQRPPLQHSVQTAYYGQNPGAQPLVSPPAQYPNSAAYPPAIYPLTAYGGQQQQQVPPKPVFYQRIFSGNRSGSKAGKRRSY